MSVTLAWEPGYDRFFDEGLPLIVDHWHEVGSHRDVLSLNPNHDIYRGAEARGALHILVARDASRMVGYLLLYILPHPRDQSATVAMDDLIYVAPAYRARLVGWRMLRAALAYMEALGVNIAFLREKARRRKRGNPDRPSFLERLGFTPHEVVYSRLLRAPGAPA